MRLSYKAVDKSGRVTTDIIEASDTAEASEKLRQQGLFVTAISANASAVDREEEHASRSSARHLKDLALWSRQLCVLVRSGTPLADALIAIEKQTTPGAWQDMLMSLRQQVEEGIALSDAMASKPEFFDDVCRSLIAAGESSGQLGPMLDRLATLIRQQLKVRRSLIGSMIYPALLIFVGMTVTMVMLLLVLPRFSELFSSLNAPLPPTTHLLMGLSEFIRTYWWGILIVLAIFGVTTKIVLSGASGRRLLDQTLVRLPFVGKMVRSLATARIARLLGVMLESKVPLLEALRLTRHSTGNSMYMQLMTRAVDAATRGDAISTVFSRSPLINASVSEAIRHGETNGQIGPILLDMADFLEEENEAIVKSAMSVLEPLILICLGLVVGFIALSLFIPLFDLTATAGT